ncbi:MAG: SDR family oxidoreductase [Bacteroidales bacterium]|nr:SDR family oxidoreductase [Bacteroidales bacterium]
MKGSDAFSMDGKVVLITGGGAGIGRSCALILSKAGAKIFLVDLLEQRAAAVKAEIESEGGECDFLCADISVEENCSKAVSSCVGRFGRLDTLINCAGMQGKSGDLEKEFDSENFGKIIGVDLGGTFMMCKYAYPECSKTKGSIINIASLAALRASGPLAYTAAKGAIRSFSKALAFRLGEKGVRVNTIYPGFVLTEMTMGVLDRPDLKERFEKDSPMHILGKAEDIAYCALYLASDAARFVTGQDFVIDGGAMCM